MRRLFRLAALAVWVAPAAAGELPERQQRWLADEVDGIISDYEGAAFRAAVDNRVRAEFIASFWEARDPTPANRDNERRRQHDDWSKQADELFQVERQRIGRGTSRGRLHVQLGPPLERLLYTLGPGSRPIEDWLYDGISPGLGLPRSFHVLFYRPSAASDYVLYDPVAHGPEALVAIDGEPATDRAAALARLTAVSPELASASLSLIPWQPGDVTTGEASSSSQSLVIALGDLRNRLPVDLSYVARVLSGAGGTIPATTGFQALELACSFHGAFGDDAGTAHFVLELPVGYPTLVRGEAGRLDGGVMLRGRVIVADSSAVALYVDEVVELSLTDESHERVSAFPLAIEDALAMHPGKYRAQLVVQDRVTARLGFVETPFEVPERQAGGIALGPLLVVARTVAATAESERPFSFGDEVLYPALGNRVAGDGELALAFEVAYAAGQHADGDELRLRYDIGVGDLERMAGFSSLVVHPSKDAGVARQVLRVALRGLEAGSYVVRVTVRDGDASAARAVSITVAAAVSRANPVIYVRKQPRGLEHRAFSLARQSSSAGFGDVRAGLERTLSYATDPALNRRTRLWLAAEDLTAGEPARVLIGLQPLLVAPAVTRAAALRQIAAAYTALGGHEDAARALADLIELSPNSTVALNALADAALATRDDARAIASLRRSLECDPAQKEVVNRLRALERPVKPNAR